MAMKIPSAHLLGDPRREGDIFIADCACRTPIYGDRLWKIYDAHQLHLNVVREMSRRTHPSGGLS